MDILALTHRSPFPPDRGDRTRSYHLLRELAKEHRVWLGALDDEPLTEHAREELASIFHRYAVFRQTPLQRLLGAGWSLLGGDPLTLGWFHQPQLKAQLDRWRLEQKFDAVFVFSSSMAPYWLRLDRQERLPAVVDFIDVDSEKWADYARHGRPPKSWIHSRESRTLATYEERIAERAAACLLVSEAECKLLAPRVDDRRLFALPNGVDLDFWAPPELKPSPRRPRIIFSGRMDYMPNIDAARWFVLEILPRIRKQLPNVDVAIVGARPDKSLHELEKIHGVELSGWVEDVRPWMWGSQLAVAPMRIARGVQNKVLEAMAAGVPVVATPGAATGIIENAPDSLLVAADEEEFASACIRLLEDRIFAEELATRARDHVAAGFSWEAAARRLEAHLISAAKMTELIP